MLSLGRIEKVFGSAKFAVVIILVFAAAMATGTFFESYYGTEYSGRAIYKAWPFIVIQGLMLLSVFYALLQRLPARKMFYGFYTIHAGLITLFCGSFVTWYAGVDGQLTLSPGNPSRMVSLGRDKVTIVEHGQRELSYLLPYTAGPARLDKSWKQITLVRYLPFGENRLEWVDSPGHLQRPSSQYYLSNENVGEELVMGLHPLAAQDFPAAAQLGPLQVYYLPEAILPCMDKTNSSGLILYNAVRATCFTPEERGIELKTAHSGKTFLVVEEEGQHYSFFPDASPWPLVLDGEGKLQSQADSHLRVLSKFFWAAQKGPQLLLMGRGLAYYDRDEQQWEVGDFEGDDPVDLPWMGFEIQLLRHERGKYPRWVPRYRRPRQANNKLIAGDLRAVEVDIAGKTHWVTSERPLGVMIDRQKYSFYLGQETLRLPFEVNLSQFKMDTDPGTQNPASYESFVNVLSPEGVSRHHVFMNNPLKFSGFTLYQASYFPLEDGRYGSVLSVNFDPGRFLKYLGCILLVLGAVWHFVLRRKKIS